MKRWWMGTLGALTCGCAIEEGDPELGPPGGAPSGTLTSSTINAVAQQGPWSQFDLDIGRRLCGVLQTGELDCPGAQLLGITLPDGPFVAVELTGGAFAGCGLRASGEVACFDQIAGSRLVGEVPSGPFTALAGHSFIGSRMCALTDAGAVICWGEPSDYPPPEETFVSLSAWNDTLCGVKSDGQLSCWNAMRFSQEVVSGVPDGQWDAVSVGYDYACAVREQLAQCWGDVPGDEPPDEPLVVLDAGEANTCGVRADGTAACWGTNGWGQLDVPEGQFDSVQPALEQVCGLRADGDVTCWGFGF